MLQNHTKIKKFTRFLFWCSLVIFWFGESFFFQARLLKRSTPTRQSSFRWYEDLSELNSKSPNSIAAASIYLAANFFSIYSNLKTIQEIAKTCGITENTIKQAIKIMQLQINKLLPPDFYSKNFNQIWFISRLNKIFYIFDKIIRVNIYLVFNFW